MSFISVVVCEKYLTVMADSRSVELYTNGNVHRIKEEDRDKIILITDNMFFSVTGLVEDAEEFIEKSDLQQNILENGLLKDKCGLEVWFSNYQNQIITDYSYRIKFGGVDIDGKLNVYSIDSTGKKLSELLYADNHLSYFLSASKCLDHNLILSAYKDLCQFYDATAESMLKIQATLNDYVADNDISVNKNKKWFCIKKVQSGFIATNGNWNP